MTIRNYIPTSIKWVKISLFAQHTDYTIDAIKAKRQKGVWKDGVIIKKAPDGCLLINVEAYYDWVESGS